MNSISRLNNLLSDFNVIEGDVSGAAADLNQRLVTIGELLTQLGPALTHSDATKRQSGLQFVAGVMWEIQSGILNEEECQLLIKFLVDRLKDINLMHPQIIQGFHALISEHAKLLSDDDHLTIIRCLFDDINTQSLTVQDRTRIFEILSWHLSNKLDLLKTPNVSSQFVLGFIQAVEGETNPSNLVVIFSCWPVVIKEMEVSMFNEDIFETLSCYFPIDFSPPKNSNFSITRSDLSSGLHNCLASSDQFAPWAIPLFLEKLSSDLNESKLEALRCFQLCLEIYSPRLIKNHLKEIWTQCKQEIMGIRTTNPDPEVIKESFKLLRLLTRNLCESVQSAENSAILLSWIEITWSEMKPFLKFLESNLVETAVSILSCLCSAHQVMGEHILKETISVLLDVYQVTEDKVRIYDLISQLLSTAHPLTSTPDWARRYLLICEADAKSGDLKLRAAAHKAAAEASLKLHYSFFDGLLIECFNRFNREFDYVSMTTKQEVISALEKKRPNFLLAWCGSRFPKKVSKVQFFPLVSFMCSESNDIMAKIFPEILKSLDSDDPVVLCELLKVVNSIPVEKVAGHWKFLKEQLCKISVEGDDEISSLRSNILANVFRCLRRDGETQDFDDFLKIFMENPCRGLSRKELVPILCGSHPDVMKQSKLIETFLQTTSLHDDSELPAIVSGSFCNKMYPEKCISNFLEDLLKKFDNHFLNVHWLTKALLMRGAKEGLTFLQKYITQARKEENYDEQKFISIISECPFYTTNNHHKTLSFYKQKFFLHTFPILMGWFENEKQERYLEMIMMQLPHIPKAIVSNELLPKAPKLIEVLFKSDNVKLPRASKIFLNYILGLDSANLEGMSEAVIPVLLDLALNHEVDLTDRVSGLDLLFRFADEKCPKEIKSLVVKRTGLLLDDKKRLIRRAAVDARNAWLLV